MSEYERRSFENVTWHQIHVDEIPSIFFINSKATIFNRFAIFHLPERNHVGLADIKVEIIKYDFAFNGSTVMPA